MIPSPSGDADPMEVDLHSRGSISVVHKLEVAAYSNHGLPPPGAQPLPSPAISAQASNTTVPLGRAISLPVDDVLARMSPNTPVEDALLDRYLMLSKAGSPLYLLLRRDCWLRGEAHLTHIPEGCNSTSSRNFNQMNAAKAQCSSSSTDTSCT
jgi:hypothetical protein